MKYFLMTLLAVGSFAAQAADTFNCDFNELSNDAYPYNKTSVYSIVVEQDGYDNLAYRYKGYANVYATGVWENDNLSLKHTLNLHSVKYFSSRSNFQKELQDWTVSFEISQSGRTGVLKFVGIEFEGTSGERLFLCKKK